MAGGGRDQAGAGAEQPAEALDRLNSPADAMARITEALTTGGSIVVSDQGITAAAKPAKARISSFRCARSRSRLGGRLRSPRPGAVLEHRRHERSLPPRPHRPSRRTAAKDAFDRLTFLGWRWGLAAIVAGLAVSFFLFGYAVIYWRNADMDFMVIYNALALNDGKPQQFFDHTAYLTILSTKFWFQLLHALGLLDAWSLSSIPPASNVAGLRCRDDQRGSRRARARTADRHRLRADLCRR